MPSTNNTAENAVIPLGQTLYEVDLENFGLARMCKTGIETGTTLHRFRKSGTCKNKEERDELVKKIITRHSPVVYEFRRKNDVSMFLVNHISTLSLDYPLNKDNLSVDFATFDANILEEFKGLVSCLDEKGEEKQGNVYSLMQVENGLKIQNLGKGGSLLQSTNYTKTVFEDFKYIVNQLNSPSPNGKIVIFDGVPGCGKTFALKGLIHEVDSTFIILPPSMLSSLDGPQLINVLVKHRQDYSDDTGKSERAIVLVLEDGDTCIAPRGIDNMSSISTLLNMSDGILGECLNLRIVATTNAKYEEIDTAILRPGRLLKRIEIGPRNYNDANIIYNRILSESGKEPREIPKKNASRNVGFARQNLNNSKDEYTLAEIYGLAAEAI